MRISVSAIAATLSNWPLGRTNTRSSVVVSTPADDTSFCALIACPSCCGEMPSRVSFALSTSMKMRWAGSPK